MVDGSASTDDHLMLDGQSTDPSTDSHLLMSDQSPEGDDEHLHGSSSDKLQGSGEDAGHRPITFLQPAHLHLTPITPTKKSAASSKSVTKKHLRHKWLRMDEEGDTTEVELGKYALTHRLGIQIRDLRLLDAQAASSPPAILCRDQAIVVNLEFIKCIITTRYVLIMQTGEEQVAAFVGEHQRRLRDPTNGLAMPLPGQGGKFAMLTNITEELPFELKVLEVVLDFVTTYIEFLSSDLEASAHPVLDTIVQRVTRGNLEALRAIKNRMVRLFTRVETIRELLERLLDDDDDMRDINLTAKARNVARVQKLRMEYDLAFESRGGRSVGRDLLRTPSGDGYKPFDAYDKEGENEREKDQVEQVLETYFMNLDNTYNKLQTLNEYIDDTEDYVRFEIDTQRNRFIEYRLVLQMITFCVFVVANMANILTMNLGIGYDTIGEGTTFRDSYPVFVATCVVACLGSTAALVMLLFYMRFKRML